jgi:hypothetical protein
LASVWDTILWNWCFVLEVLEWHVLMSEVTSP